MQSGLKKDKIFTDSFIKIFFCNLYAFSSITSMVILPVHLKDLGASNLYIGIFNSIPSIELILFVFIYGLIAYKINRRKLLIYSFIITIIFRFFMFLHYQSLPLLMLFMIFSSVSFAVGFTMLFSMIYDIIPNDKRRSAVAFYGISGIGSNSIGSILSEFFYKINAKYIFLASAFFSFLALVIIVFISVEKSKNTSKMSIINLIQTFINKKFPLLIFYSMIMGGIYGIFISFMPNYSKIILNIPNISFFLIAFTIMAIFIRSVSFKILDIIKSRVLIFITYTAYLISLLITLFLFAKWQLFLIGFIFGLGHSIIFPTLSVKFVNRAEESNRDIYNNIFLVFNTLGTILFQTILGFVGDIFSLHSIFSSMLFIVIIGLIFSTYTILKK